MNPTIVIAIVASFAAGLVVGTLYGRKAEQKIIGTTLAEFSAAGRISRTVFDSLHVRLTYLKKYL